MEARANRPRYTMDNPHPESQVAKERRAAALAEEAAKTDPSTLPSWEELANTPFREDC